LVEIFYKVVQKTTRQKVMDEEQKDSAAKTKQDKTLRIALIASEKTISDYPTFLEHLLTGLADESIPTALVCPLSWEADSAGYASVDIIRHPAFKLPLMGGQNKKVLIEQLKKFEPTVLHCLCESKGQLTRQLARQLDLPYILTVNSMPRRFRELRISTKHLIKIIVPAKSIAAYLEDNFPKFAGKIEQINIGTFVEDNFICFSKSGQLPSILLAHHLDNADEFENLFGALKHLAIDGNEFMLLITGGGRAERKLRKMLNSLGLSQMVTIVPRMSPQRSVLSTGDIFIRPASTDTFDPLLLEAMSVGSAVAACKGGVDDLIIEDITAVVFEPDDELNIYDSLRRLFNRHEWAQQLAKGAQDYLKENHTVSGMISAMLNTYREAQKQFNQEDNGLV